MAGKTTLQFGSKGDDVKELQQYLNNNGYSLNVDGDFGNNTLSAVKDYQQKNGLDVDGIVGDNTWGKLLGSNTSANSSGYTPTAAPTIAPAPTAPKYDTSSWDDSTKGSAASGAYEAAKEALNNYGSFNFSENKWLEGIKDNIKNYDKFSYDVNSDALYQQYAEQYARMGKMASADVMGQAAAMTGGYGNSYAATVGNQAYQSYIQQLNDKVPELYQLALEQHNMEKQDLYNQYSMLLSEYEREYGLYSDEYNKLLDSLGIAKDDYYSGADMFYTEQGNKNNVLGQEFSDAMSLWEADTNNKWAQAEWDESANRYANEEAWRQKEYDLSNRQVTLQEKSYEDSKKAASTSSSSSSSSSKGTSGNGTNSAGTSGITAGIKNKAASFESNTALANYLDGLVASGTISEADSDALYAEYVDDNEKYVDNEDGSKTISYKSMLDSTSGWSVIDDGGVNWFGIGIDADAIVKAPNGEQIRLDNLREKLKSEGMTTSEANNLIKSLMKNLGI